MKTARFCSARQAGSLFGHPIVCQTRNQLPEAKIGQFVCLNGLDRKLICLVEKEKKGGKKTVVFSCCHGQIRSRNVWSSAINNVQTPSLRGLKSSVIVFFTVLQSCCQLTSSLSQLIDEQ